MGALPDTFMYDISMPQRAPAPAPVRREAAVPAPARGRSRGRCGGQCDAVPAAAESEPGFQAVLTLD